HSISTAVAFAEWQNTKINFIDTPGFGIFVMEARTAMRVADSAAIVVSGVTGVEVSTERVWKFAEEFELPRLVVINKMDRERASFTRTLDALQNKFGKNVVPIQLPIGEEKDFAGVIDLVSMKAWKYALDGSGKYETIEIPGEMKSEADDWRAQLIEKVAEGDDTLMERFSDHFYGRVSLFRVYSGTFQSDHTYWNTTKDHEERVGKLQLIQGKQQVPVSELKAGDIGAVAKLKDVHTGDTLATTQHSIVLE